MRAFRRLAALGCVILATLLAAAEARAETLARDDLVDYIVPPFSLGEPVNDKGVWQLLNSGGAHAGFVFETEPLAPLPGFSGAPINLLVMLDLDGSFMHVRLISHNEPIFVSGLGEGPVSQVLRTVPGPFDLVVAGGRHALRRQSAPAALWSISTA